MEGRESILPLVKGLQFFHQWELWVLVAGLREELYTRITDLDHESVQDQQGQYHV